MSFTKRNSLSALTDEAQWDGCHPANQKVTGLMPGEGTDLGCSPRLGACERQQIHTSLSHPCFSPLILPPFYLSLQINNCNLKEKFLFIEKEQTRGRSPLFGSCKWSSLPHWHGLFLDDGAFILVHQDQGSLSGSSVIRRDPDLGPRSRISSRLRAGSLAQDLLPRTPRVWVLSCPLHTALMEQDLED